MASLRMMRWWMVGLVVIGALTVIVVGRDLGVADTGTASSEMAVDLEDPLDGSFHAVVHLEVNRSDGGRYGQDFIIDYRDRNDWTMVTSNAYSDRELGAQPDEDGTLTIARDGWLRVYSEPVHSVSDLGLDAARLGEIQRGLGTSGEEIIEQMIADDLLKTSARLLGEIELDPRNGATPLGLFSMEYLRSSGPITRHEDSIEFSSSSLEDTTTYVYDLAGNPVRSRTVGADGTSREMTVVTFMPTKPNR